MHSNTELFIEELLWAGLALVSSTRGKDFTASMQSVQHRSRQDAVVALQSALLNVTTLG